MREVRTNQLPGKAPARPSPTMALLLVVCSCITGAARCDELVHRRLDTPSPGGKNLVMQIDEVRRAERTSTVRVRYVSGASVPGSMAVLCVLADISRARKATHFAVLRSWIAPKGEAFYFVGFTSDPTVDLDTYFPKADMEAGSIPDPDPPPSTFFNIRQVGAICGHDGSQRTHASAPRR